MGAALKKSSIKVVKRKNTSMLLRYIHSEKDLSRAELKRLTGLSPTTVSTLVDELIEEGLVKETGVLETKSSGRKAVSLEINPSGRHFAGIEIDGEKIVVDVYDLKFNLVLHKDTESKSYPEILKFIVDALKEAEDEENAKIYSIIIGFSGIIDAKLSKTLLSTVVDISYGDFVADIKSEFMSARVELLNTSELIAFAEKEKRNLNDLISIDIGKGVGSGIIIDGKIYKGVGGTAGEFGHISVDMNGPVCKCGNRGCTELYTNTTVIKERAKKILNKDKISLADIMKESENGNEEIKAMLSDIAQILSFSVVGLINMMAPESIVISGKITELGDEFLNPLKIAVAQKCSVTKTQIEYSKVKGNNVTLGAAQYAFSKMLG